MIDQPGIPTRAWRLALDHPCQHHHADPGHTCWNTAVRAMCGTRVTHALTHPTAGASSATPTTPTTGSSRTPTTRTRRR